MSNNVVTMQNVRGILQLLQKGYSGRKIARELDLSRNTVKLYTDRFTSCAYDLVQLQQMDDAGLHAIAYADARQVQDDDRTSAFKQKIPYFLAELKRTGVTKYLLWLEYRKTGPEGYGYSQFCDLFAQYRKVHEASMHFEHQPAAVMMVDFAGDPLTYVDKDSGEVIKCPVFVAVLPCSGYSFAVALPNASQPYVIKALNMCLQYFGGSPHSLKCDNMKTAVSKSCRYEPVFTDTIIQWGLHNNVALLAARVRRPKDKASVENEVKLVYQRIYAPLRNTIFFSLAALNHHIVQQLREHHRHLLQKKDYSRHQRFVETERPMLQALPAEPYCIRHSVKAKVQRNYHITLGEDRHHYSVPFGLIGKTVSAIYDTDTVEIYFENKRMALHTRSFKRHGFSTIKEHMPESHKRYSEQQGWTPDYFLGQAARAGPSTVQYIQKVLDARRFTEQTYNACLGIMRLALAYTPQRLEAACKRALTGQAYNYTTINNILVNNLDTLELPGTGQPALFTMPEHNNLRGPAAYS
jgi:transposase